MLQRNWHQVLQYLRLPKQSSISYSLTYTDLLTMGSCHHQNFDNPDIFKDEKSIISSIKSSSTQDILSWINQYQEINAITMYSQFLAKIDRQYKSVWKRPTQEMQQAMRKEKNESNADYFNYHMNQVCKHILLSDEAEKLIEKQYQANKQLLTKKNKEWKKNFAQLLQANKQNRQIKSQILMNPSIDDTNDQKYRKTSTLKGLQKFQQCKEKIEQSFCQSPDLQQNQLKDVVMCQTNKIEEIIQEHRRQIELLNQRIESLNLQAKQKTKKSNLRSEQLVQKIYQRDIKIQGLEIKVKQLQIKLKYYQDLSQKFQSLESHSTNKSLTTKSKRAQQKKMANDEFLFGNNQNQQSLHKASFSSSIQFKKFSNSLVLFANNDYHIGKKYREIIERMFDPIKIQSSKLKYTYDKIRPNNMFLYVENQQNLLLLCRLKNGTILGGFSRLGFKEKQQKLIQNICFIFCIRSQNEYYKLELKEQGMAKYSVKLDNNYLKMGSNQIRISCGTNQGCSAVNCSSAIFTCKEKTISTQQFLGQTDDKFELETYEIYEIQCQYPNDLLKRSQDAFRSEVYDHL